MTRNLLLVNVLIFLVMAIAGPYREAQADRYLALHYFSSPDFNPAQLLTYMFLHGNFTHLFFNMFALYMFGPSIEQAFGSKRFLFYYISCGLGAALIQEGVFAVMLIKYDSIFPPELRDMIINTGMAPADPVLHGYAQEMYWLVNTPVVGASGAIYGVLLAFGMLWPDMKLMLLIPPMPIKAKWLVLGYAAIELLLGVTGSADGIAHFCHLGGMLVGLLIILYWRHRSRPRRGPSPRDEEAELDRLLDKVHRTGYDSLTAHERQRLFELSNKFRK